MTATDIARIILVVQFLILGLYSVASEEPLFFNSSLNSNDIKICRDNKWQLYQNGSDGPIQFVTADVKQRILYWVTPNGFFSLDVDDNKTSVNLSEKFKNGLVFQVLFQRAVALYRLGIMVFRVHDGQIIFAEKNWGLMKFDLKTNRQLFRLKDVKVTEFYPSNSILSIDYYGNEASCSTGLQEKFPLLYHKAIDQRSYIRTVFCDIIKAFNSVCLYWSGPRYNQISRYLINSNINQIVVQDLPEDWAPLNVQLGKVYWTSVGNMDFRTNFNLQNRQSLIKFASYVLFHGTMYYYYHRNITSQLSKIVYPLKPYFCPCPDKTFSKLVVLPGSVYEEAVVVDDVVEDVLEDADIEDAVETGIWSTSGLGNIALDFGVDFCVDYKVTQGSGSIFLGCNRIWSLDIAKQQQEGLL
ncbi:hypothetical protein LOTGIDRAFT_239002 [Lottia gigantea]|uniref:Olfactomedin-like domain-containing protein n=1 Tax=Lottia gigantea TaxID=225164 RepID=V4AY98_LOTGI|nr:hypothetical protein LOTGIDRAFT_239002 [Lottia gigantea]ESO98591.1 hypothetical protein LOTGIDRAFT_239002 [Lottia gigantea]